MGCCTYFPLCTENDPLKVLCLTLNDYTKSLVFVMELLTRDHCRVNVKVTSNDRQISFNINRQNWLI